MTSNKHQSLPFDPSMYRCSDKQSPLCQNQTSTFRKKILNEFKKTIQMKIDEPNFYNVDYTHDFDWLKYNPTCMMLDAKVRPLNQNDSPFDRNKIGRLFPVDDFLGDHQARPQSCVIISSAGSIAKSGLGQFVGNFCLPKKCMQVVASVSATAD